MDKPFKSINDQIEILESRNLIIANHESAKNALVRYGYYEVVNGYKDLFMVSNDDSDGFIPGTTFEHLESLYQLDRSVRYGVVEALETLEANIRQAVAYVVAENISEDQRYTLIEINIIRARNIKKGITVECMMYGRLMI